MTLVLDLLASGKSTYVPITGGVADFRSPYSLTFIESIRLGEEEEPACKPVIV